VLTPATSSNPSTNSPQRYSIRKRIISMDDHPKPMLIPPTASNPHTAALGRRQKRLEPDNIGKKNRSRQTNSQQQRVSALYLYQVSISYTAHCTTSLPTYPIRHRPLRLFPDSAQNRILQDPPITASRTTPTDLDAAS
jgi:hypothetical protein